MGAQFEAASRAKVVINEASFRDAKALKKAIQRQLSSSSAITLDSGMSEIIRAVMLVDSSDEVDAALWPCLARCTRDGEKIIEITFDDPEARRDYYEIVAACVKENLGPLVQSLFSQLSKVDVLAKQAQSIQKSE